MVLAIQMKIESKNKFEISRCNKVYIYNRNEKLAINIVED